MYNKNSLNQNFQVLRNALTKVKKEEKGEFKVSKLIKNKMNKEVFIKFSLDYLRLFKSEFFILLLKCPHFFYF